MKPALAATLAVSAVEPLERALLGTEPVYSARSVASRLFGARVGRRVATPLRYAYGFTLGAVASRALRGRSAVSIAAAVSALELVVMPAVGATPPLRKWPPRQFLTFLLHTLAFGVVLARRTTA